MKFLLQWKTVIIEKDEWTSNKSAYLHIYNNASNYVKYVHSLYTKNELKNTSGDSNETAMLA